MKKQKTKQDEHAIEKIIGMHMQGTLRRMERGGGTGSKEVGEKGQTKKEHAFSKNEQRMATEKQGK